MRMNIDTNEPIINRLHGDKVIWIVVFLLSLASIALIYSSSSSLAFKEGVTNLSFLMDQCKFVALGLAALYICYKIPLGLYRYFTFLIFAVTLVLLMLTPVIGKEINGAKRWLEFGPISFQPAELIKITLILYLARALEMWEMKTFKEFFTKIVIPIGLVCVFIMMSSVSTALIIGMLSFAILFIAGVKWSYLLKAIGIGAGTLTVLILMNLALIGIFDVDLFPRFSTALSRLEKYFVKTELAEGMSAEEKQKKADETFQADMAKIAISSANIFGKGPGKSTQRYVLPHPYSDFIYTIIIEEYGLLGGVVVLMFYLWLFYRCIILVRSCSKKFTAITVGGLGLMITTQAGLHILVNVGILPVTGHTLPLISLGGTSFIIFSCAFGIILSVSRTIDIDAAKREEQERLLREKMEQQALERAQEEYRAIAEENQRIETEKDEPEFHDIIDENTGEFK